jgi:hypothetical protein
MVHVTRRNLALGFTGAAALLLVTALPAFADHTAGAELSGGEIANDSCYVGGLVSGIPATLNTDNYVIKDYDGSRHLACYFETAPSYTPSGVDGETYDWPWTAPTRLTKWTGYDSTCIEPGGDELGYTEAAQSAPRFAQYKTHLVMYCSWPLDELAYP